jgi:hypothetical protein
MKKRLPRDFKAVPEVLMPAIAGLVFAALVCAAFFISSCDTPMNNTIILPAVAGSGGTPGAPVTTPTPGAVLYDITVAPGITNGTITPNKAGSQAAAEGEAITLLIAPDPLYQLKSGTLKYNDGADHAISGTLFIMPASNVTITGEFELIPIGGINIPVTGIDLDKSSLRIYPRADGHYADHILTATVRPGNTTGTVTWAATVPNFVNLIVGDPVVGADAVTIQVTVTRMADDLTSGNLKITAASGGVAAECAVVVTGYVQ